MTNEPNTAAIEAAWLEINDDQKDDIMAYFRFFKLGYESAKAANDLALQLAYESGKEAAEGNGWVRCEDRLPEGYRLYNVAWFNIVEFITCSAIFAEGRWWSDDGEAFPREVIAWMPLPEYTGE